MPKQDEARETTAAPQAPLRRKLILPPCDVIRPPTSDPERTFVVLGMPSGGTSMLSGTLRLLGVHMGDDVDSANQEDRAFNSLASLGSRERRARIRELVAERDGKHKVWGWKDPHAVVYLSEIEKQLRNPHFLVIFRDSHASAQRINHRSGTPHLQTISSYLQHLQKLVDYVATSQAPLLLASYERAVLRAEDFTKQVAEFVGAPLDEEALNSVTSYVRPNRGGGNIDPEARARDQAILKERAAGR